MALPRLDTDTQGQRLPHPFLIEVDVPRLQGRLSSVAIPPESNAIGLDAEEAAREFVRYASCYDRSKPDIERKVAHSLRVALLCHDIATHRNADASTAPVDVAAMTLAGLLHDVGRFPQWAIHQGYQDYANGCDHGHLSFMLLSEFGMLGRFIDADVMGHDGAIAVRRMLRAVDLHNKWLLPDGMDASERAYADDLRDADIIDILDIAASPTGMPHDPTAISDAASPSVMASVRSGRTVDRACMTNGTDVIVSRLALTFAVRSERGRQLIAEHASWDGYLAKCDISGDAVADIAEALDGVRTHLGIR